MSDKNEISVSGLKYEYLSERLEKMTEEERNEFYRNLDLTIDWSLITPNSTNENSIEQKKPNPKLN